MPSIFPDFCSVNNGGAIPSGTTAFSAPEFAIADVLEIRNEMRRGKSFTRKAYYKQSRTVNTIFTSNNYNRHLAGPCCGKILTL
jgi:hypothetical protein